MVLWTLLSSGPQKENQRKRKEIQVLKACQRTKKVVAHESVGNTNCKWHTWNGPQRLEKRTRRGGDRRRNRDYPDYTSTRILRRVQET